MISSIAGAFQYLYDLFLISPLRTLYMYGPMFYNIGFWEGKEPSEICQAMTNHKQLFWEENPGECHVLIENRFYAFKTTIEVLLYFLVLYRAVETIVWGCSCFHLFGSQRSAAKREIVFVPIKRIANKKKMF